MKERPILFNSEMVRAVLDERKSQTRRVIKNACDIVQDWDKNDPQYGPYYEDEYGDSHKTIERCPYGKVGDQLWVRETFQFISPDERWRSIDECNIIYKATDKHPGFDAGEYAENMGLKDTSPIWDMGEVYPWKPSIFLPRWASRIQLEITNIRVERVQDISEEDILSEGFRMDSAAIISLGYQEAFKRLWDSINLKRGFGWAKNPWVWCVEFKVLTQ